MGKTILITGASGNIGRELVAELKSRELPFIAGSASGKRIDGVETRHVDFNDVAGMVEAFTGVDTLFLLLPLTQNKLELARNAVLAAKQAGVSHIVRASGAGADVNSALPLPRLQGQIDQLIIDSGIAYTLLRPNSFMQNFATYQQGMVKAGTLYLPYGDAAVSYVDTRDIAAVAATALANPAAHAGQTYMLTGGRAVSTQAAVEALSRATGRTVQYVPVSDDAAVNGMRQAGLPEWMIEIFSSLNALIRAGHTAGVSPDVERVLGRAPIAFETFAADYAAAWR
ncbi:MAG: SDR family oxidoreductase [Burkholderiales bacterium]|nr:SDR family oxidoreductase [Burkholderiales bacterium]